MSEAVNPVSGAQPAAGRGKLLPLVPSQVPWRPGRKGRLGAWVSWRRAGPVKWVGESAGLVDQQEQRRRRPCAWF